MNRLIFIDLSKVSRAFQELSRFFSRKVALKTGIFRKKKYMESIIGVTEILLQDLRHVLYLFHG